MRRTATGHAAIVAAVPHDRAPRSRSRPRLPASLAEVRLAARAHEDPVALLAALAWAGGLAHAFAVGAHWDEWRLAAVFFGVLSVAQFAWGALAYNRPVRPVLLVGALGSLAVVALWVVSRTTGLPLGPDPGTPEPVGTLDAMATVSELLTAGLALTLLRPRLAARIPGTAVYLALILTLTAMILSGGGHHHHAG